MYYRRLKRLPRVAYATAPV